MEGRAGQQVRPPHHGQHADAKSPARRPATTSSRPRPIRPAAGARHAEQLRRRRDAVGHLADGEENFNGYFGGDAEKMPDAKAYKRYGISKATWYAWAQHSTASTSRRSRTSPTASAGSSRSIPTIRGSTPVKRTALGRFKHEGCHHAAGQGRPRRHLHGRRRALRLRLQVRHGEAVEPPATAPPTATCWTRARSTSRASPTTARSSGCRWSMARVR